MFEKLNLGFVLYSKKRTYFCCFVGKCIILNSGESLYSNSLSKYTKVFTNYGPFTSKVLIPTATFDYFIFYETSNIFLAVLGLALRPSAVTNLVRGEKQ